MDSSPSSLQLSLLSLHHRPQSSPVTFAWHALSAALGILILQHSTPFQVNWCPSVRYLPILPLNSHHLFFLFCRHRIPRWYSLLHQYCQASPTMKLASTLVLSLLAAAGSVAGRSLPELSPGRYWQNDTYPTTDNLAVFNSTNKPTQSPG